MIERREYRSAGLLAGRMALFASIQVASTPPARAHPHVWVNVETTVLYDQGKVAGFTHRWTFDDMYTAMAVQGLDKNQMAPSRARSSPNSLRSTSTGEGIRVRHLRRIKESPSNLPRRRTIRLEHKNGVLSLNFTLPIAEPVPAEAEGFEFAVYDQTFFIAFDLAKKTQSA